MNKLIFSIFSGRSQLFKGLRFYWWHFLIFNPLIFAGNGSMMVTSSSDAILLPRTLFTTRGSTSVLQYSPKSELDFGVVACWASNPVGNQREPCLFHVVPAGNILLTTTTAPHMFVTLPNVEPSLARFPHYQSGFGILDTYPLPLDRIIEIGENGSLWKLGELILLFVCYRWIKASRRRHPTVPFTIKRLIRFELIVKRLSMGAFSKHSDWNWSIETRAPSATFSTTPNPSSRSTDWYTQRIFPGELLFLSSLIKIRTNEGYMLSRF